MKTNVSIKFNSIEEYREIEKKLEQLGYVNDKDFKNIMKMCMYNKIRIFNEYSTNLEFLITALVLNDSEIIAIQESK